MIQFFEPHVLVVGLQHGKQFQNEERNLKRPERLGQLIRNIKTFEIDAYSTDHGFSAIVEQIKPLLPDYNIIAASLGPKTSAIAMFRVIAEFPEIAWLTHRPVNSTLSILRELEIQSRGLSSRSWWITGFNVEGLRVRKNLRPQMRITLLQERHHS